MSKAAWVLRMSKSAFWLQIFGAVTFFTAGATYAFSAVPDVQQLATVADRVADLARQKDIVWLALVVAIVSMVISAVKDYFVYRVLNDMKANLDARPCSYKVAEARATMHKLEGSR